MGWMYFYGDKGQSAFIFAPNLSAARDCLKAMGLWGRGARPLLLSPSPASPVWQRALARGENPML